MGEGKHQRKNHAEWAGVLRCALLLLHQEPQAVKHGCHGGGGGIKVRVAGAVTGAVFGGGRLASACRRFQVNQGKKAGHPSQVVMLKCQQSLTDSLRSWGGGD